MKKINLLLLLVVLPFSSCVERTSKGYAPEFETMAQVDKKIMNSGKPLVYDVASYGKVGNLRMMVNKVIIYDHYTQVEMFVENMGNTNASYTFPSALDSRVKGYYISAGGQLYKSTSVNDKTSYVLEKLVVVDKKLLVINFEPIPRNTKVIKIQTGDGSSNTISALGVRVDLGRPKVLEQAISENFQQREDKYRAVAPRVYNTDFVYDQANKELELKIKKVTLSYNRTYVDIDLKNYSQNIPCNVSLNTGINKGLFISVRGVLQSQAVQRIILDNKPSTQNSVILKVPAQSTTSVRLLFNAVPMSTRSITIEGLLGQSNKFVLPIRREL